MNIRIGSKEYDVAEILHRRTHLALFPNAVRQPAWPYMGVYLGGCKAAETYLHLADSAVTWMPDTCDTSTFRNVNEAGGCTRYYSVSYDDSEVYIMSRARR